jgi:carbonic anhydrase/acetyltransferase-like protein (isoleucine patch superfamily)
VHPDARVSSSAQVIGNVTIREGAFVDHNAVIASSGPPIHIGANSIVLAGSVVRAPGGNGRPPFAMTIGQGTLVAPLCSLVGCEIGGNCYVATGVIELEVEYSKHASKAGRDWIRREDIQEWLEWPETYVEAVVLMDKPNLKAFL